MDCSDFSERLSVYADGELRGPEARLVEEHLSSCSRCAGQLQYLRVLQGRAAEALEQPREVPDIADSVMMLLPTTQRKPARWVWAIAAGVCVVLVALWMLTSHPQRKPEVIVREPVEQQVQPPVSTERTPAPVNRQKIAEQPHDALKSVRKSPDGSEEKRTPRRTRHRRERVKQWVANRPNRSVVHQPVQNKPDIKKSVPEAADLPVDERRPMEVVVTEQFIPSNGSPEHTEITSHVTIGNIVIQEYRDVVYFPPVDPEAGTIERPGLTLSRT